MRTRRPRLVDVLVARGLFSDVETAARWVMAGKVLVGEQRIDKPGTPIRSDAPIRIKGGERPYASRGGWKLAGALAAFGLRVTSRIVLDAGASTGGFTDCLLKHGAARVYAVDVGYGQLRGRLRADPRVVNLERTNIASLRAEQLDPQPDLATIDLSYLSLKKAIPLVVPLLRMPAEMICLVKPLYEVGDPLARRTGRIAGSAPYRSVLWDLCDWASRQGLGVRGLVASPLRGSRGAVEFFMWLAAGADAHSLPEATLQEAIERAVEQALEQTR
ncbi:MAG TPA: TlyA family RNA methyltransferase [Limnochordia bacterium]